MNKDGAQHVALEGVNAVGKTHLARQAAGLLGAACIPLVELPDSPPDHLAGTVIGTLAAKAGGDPFLRTGHPRTETLLLAALHVHRHESITPARWQAVLEDRGPHTVAAYQAAILCSPGSSDDDLLGEALGILGLIEVWRPLSDRILLIEDEPKVCAGRLTERWGRPPTQEESALMERVGRIYRLLADADPLRFQFLDRTRVSEQEAVAVIVAACRGKARPR